MNSLLDNLNQQEIYRTWFAYVNKGVIFEENLRPEIARSWQRSPHLSYNILSPLLRLEADQIRILSKKHSSLIAAASPIMEYLYAIDNNRIVILCNNEGYALKSFHKYKRNIVDYTCYHEDVIGCNTTGIILKEGAPVSVCGYEHLIPNWHSVITSGIPIRNSSDMIIGTLVISYPFNKFSNISLQSIEVLGDVIKNSLINPTKAQFESSADFTLMLDQSSSPLLLVNTEGDIVNSNTLFQDYFKVQDAGKAHLSYYTSDHSIFKILKGTEEFETSKSHSLNSGNHFSFKVANIKGIVNPAGETYYLLSLESPVEAPVQKLSFTMEPNKEKSNQLGVNKIIGYSKPIVAIKNRINKISSVRSTVLIQGESGTGKELVAQAIHAESNGEKPFIAINCGSIPKDLIESELFGYSGGSFTGANKQGNAGKFELAKGGTIFLDEIGEMPINMQVVLLRVLENRSFSRVGSSKQIEFDARIIAATNKNLLQSIRKGTFREDLYYRLNVINITLPSLHEIKEDIPFIAEHFLKNLCKQFKTALKKLDNASIAMLMRYDWPGNMRELRNIMERSVIYCDSDIITEDIIQFCLKSNAPSEQINDGNQLLNADTLYENLKENNWNISQTAKFFGISRNHLYTLIKNNHIVMASLKQKENNLIDF